MKSRTSPLAVLAVALLTAPFARAAIHADFTAGNGTQFVDQYQGLAGDGWTTPWTTNISGTNNLAPNGFTGAVTDVNPLNGGGNYLSTILLTGTGTAQGKGTQVRGYGGEGSLDLSGPYTVKFSMRLDSDLSGLSAANEYFQAFDIPGTAGSGGSDFGPTGTWLVRAFGAATGTSLQNPAHTWLLYDGERNGGGYSADRFVDSGVSLLSGVVYDFTIDMDPAALSYRVSINGGEFSQWLGYRRGTSTTTSAINFGGQISPEDFMEFSVDSIEIVPEPSTAALCLLGAGAGVLVLRHRRSRAQ